MLSEAVVRPVWSRERPEAALEREGVLLHGGLVLELSADLTGRLTLRADDPRTGRELWRLDVGRAAMATPVVGWPNKPCASLHVLDANRVIVAAIAESEVAVHRVTVDGNAEHVARFAYSGSVFGPRVSCDGAGWCAVEHHETMKLVDLISDTQQTQIAGHVVGHGEGLFILRRTDTRLVGLHAGEPYKLDHIAGGSRIINGALYEVDSFDYNEWAEGSSRGRAPTIYFNVFDARTGRRRWQKQLGRWRSRPLVGAVVFTHEGVFDVHDPQHGGRIDQVKLARHAEPVGYDCRRVLWYDADHEIGLGTSWTVPMPGVGSCSLAIEHDLLLVVHEHSLHVLA